MRAVGSDPVVIYTAIPRDSGFFMPNIQINYPVNIKALYYMPTKRRVDLCNLHECLCDVLVHYGVVIDDNSNIIVSMDGSRVLYDKNNPRTEVEITKIKE